MGSDTKEGGRAKQAMGLMVRTGLLRSMSGTITTLLGKMSSWSKRLSMMSCAPRSARDRSERLTPQCIIMMRR